MFKKLRLTLHLFVLYGFLCFSLLSLGVYSLFVIADYEKTIIVADREYLSLTRALAEVVRHQMNQALRLNEIMSFARSKEQEKFDLSNEGYIQEGKLIEENLVDGKNSIQWGLDHAESAAETKGLGMVKDSFKEIKKARKSYEELGASLIQTLYKYDFLLKKESAAVVDVATARAREEEYTVLLHRTLAPFWTEARRLENNMREALERVNDLSKTMTMNAGQQRDVAFDRMVALLVVSFGVGLLLVVLIARVYKIQEHNKNKVTGQVLAQLSAALAQLQIVMGGLQPASQRVTENFARQKESLGDTATNIQEVVLLVAEHMHCSEQLNMLRVKKRDVMAQTESSVKRLNADAGMLLEAEIESKRIVRDFKDVVIQTNLLASNAHAEACRMEATRSFGVFAEEIKTLTRSTLSMAEVILNRMEEVIKGIHADRLHVMQAQKQFAEIMTLVHKEDDWWGRSVRSLQQQSELLQTAQGSVARLHVVLQAGIPPLEQLQTVGNQLYSRSKAVQDAFGGWPG